MPQVGELVQREPTGVAKNRWLRLRNNDTWRCKLDSGRVGWGGRPGREAEVTGCDLLCEVPVNGGRNYNGPKVAKFLVG